MRIIVLGYVPNANPPAGYVYLYTTITGNLQTRDENGVIRNYSTGITPEEVQDIIGALIVDSSTIDANYDDNANTLTLHLIQAAVDHTQINNRGTNSHAQIDSHLASTANPHSTTKAQVGLGNVDNTSDINKPISTATQVALNAKYDATNPNGYETPAQLNARDVNNRSRANHTGTQLAATISDFSAAVSSIVDAAFTAHTLELDPHPQYLTPAEANGAYALIIHGHDVATQSVDGFMSAADKTKLDGIINDVLYKTTAVLSNTSNVTLQNVSELSFPVVAGKSYKFKTYLRYRTAVATTGIAVALACTGSGVLSANLRGHTSTTVASLSTLNAFNTVIQYTSAPGANIDYIIEIEGIFVCTSNGVLTPQFRSETNGTAITVRPSSLCEVKEF